MCGLYFASNVAECSISHHRLAVSLLSHRGPDALNTLYLPQSGIFLGHTRLELLSGEAGAQPYQDDRFIVLLVGEIYNVAALADELRIAFASEAAVIAAILKYWGPRSLDRLDGMFAILALDKERGHVIVHRDPFGLKQIFFIETSGKLIFSSEIAPLLHAQSTRGMPDREAMIDNFLFRVPLSNRTFYKEVTRLLPGETRIIGLDGTQIDRFTEDVGQSCFMERSSTGSPECLLDILKEDVLSTSLHRDALVTKVPLLLSSGLDSNALASFFAFVDPAVSAVTAGYPGLQTEQDESALAARAATYYGMVCQTVPVHADPVILDQVLTRLEAPIYSSSAIAIYAIGAELSRAGAKVVLVGDGADELFFGYSQLMHADNAPASLYQSRIGLAKSEIVSALTGVPKIELDHRIESALAVPNGVDTWRAYQAFELRYRIPEYQAYRLDRLFMAFGIEARVPFLRRRTVKWALSVDRAAHIARGGKTLLAAAVGPGLCFEIRGLAKKRFVAPLSLWRSGALAADMRRHVTFAALRQLGFSPSLPADALDHLSDRAAWGIYMMSKWAHLNWNLER